MPFSVCPPVFCLCRHVAVVSFVLYPDTDRNVFCPSDGGIVSRMYFFYDRQYGVGSQFPAVCRIISCIIVGSDAVGVYGILFHGIIPVLCAACDISRFFPISVDFITGNADIIRGRVPFNGNGGTCPPDHGQTAIDNGCRIILFRSDGSCRRCQGQIAAVIAGTDLIGVFRVSRQVIIPIGKGKLIHICYQFPVPVDAVSCDFMIVLCLRIGNGNAVGRITYRLHLFHILWRFGIIIFIQKLLTDIRQRLHKPVSRLFSSGKHQNVKP